VIQVENYKFFPPHVFNTLSPLSEFALEFCNSYSEKKQGHAST